MKSSPVPRSLAAVLGASSLLCAAVPARAAEIPVNVVTYHNDTARSGQYLHETRLTPATVSGGQFGKQFASAVDGEVYAQPLYVAGLSLKQQGRHNVVFIATEHDSVYAFDADTGATLWHSSLLTPTTPGAVVTTVPYTELPGRCNQITPELGVTCTPALDTTAGAIYVVAMTKETTGSAAAPSVNYFQRLHSLNVTTGAERANSPVEVNAVVAGTGDGGTQDIFVPLDYKERPGLVLLNGRVYTSWSSHCDVEPYHGWVIAYDATTLVQTNVYNFTANGSEASIWDSGAAPAVDAAGNLFINGGNGTFDVQNDDGTPNPAGIDLGQSIVKMSTVNGSLTPADYFTPFNKNTLNTNDLDLGSSGVVLYNVGANPLLTTAGKEGRIYVLNQDSLGKFNPVADTGAVQTVPEGDAGLAGPLFGSPAFFNSSVNGPTLYFAAVGDQAKAFVLDGTGRLPAAGATTRAAETFGYPGSVPSISANGGTDGVVWMLESSAVLHAYDADNLGSELYSSNGNPGRDALGSYVKFTTPIITQGRVYAGTNDHLVAYGLLAQPAATDLTSQFEVTPGALRPSENSEHLVQDVTLTYRGSTTLSGPVTLVLDALNRAATLYNADGSTTQAAPLASFYRNLIAADGSTLASLTPGETVTIRLKFDNAKNSRVVWTPRVLGGTGVR